MDVDALNMEEESGDKGSSQRIMNVIGELQKLLFRGERFLRNGRCEQKPVEQKATKSCWAVRRTIHTFRLNIARELVLKKPGRIKV